MKNSKHSVEQMRAQQMQQLHEDINEARRELFQLRLKVATGHVSSFSSDQRRLRKVVARGLTVITEKLKI